MTVQKTAVAMAETIPQWRGGKYTTITFCVTEDCNLACKYCYMLGKNTKRRMSLETAKKIVDYVLTNPMDFYEDSVAWDFIGGEPLLEMELIDQISDYILAKSYSLNHPWFYSHNFTFSTNGTLYGDPLVRKYIGKHNGQCGFGLSVDGTKEKHDRARIYKDGRGSYDDVVKNVPLWLKEFPNASTKATFSSEDLPYLKDSIINLWDLGIRDVAANLIFENVWKEGDVELFESQLRELADYIIDNELWDVYRVSFFDALTGLPVGRSELYKSRCGAGHKMLAFDCEGNIYPCIRFLEMCFPDKDKIVIGNIETGINKDYLRAFAALDWISQSPEKCNDCSCGSNCGWCEAFNFQDSSNDTVFERTIHLCEMTKANARATDYLWQRYAEVTGYTSPRAIFKAAKSDSSVIRYVKILISDDITPHCSYMNTKESSEKMSKETLAEGLMYCHTNNLLPIFLGKMQHNLVKEKNVFYEIIDLDKENKNGCNLEDFNTDTIEILKPGYECNKGRVANYIIRKENTGQICHDLSKFFQVKSRINLFIEDLSTWSEADVESYKYALLETRHMIIEFWAAGKKVHLNVLNEMLNSKVHGDCGAGVSTVTLAPNGKFYICPGFYFANEYDDIGDLKNGIAESKLRLCQRKYSPQCRECEIKSCNRCLLTNKIKTREINIPNEIQCKMQIAACEASVAFRDDLIKRGLADGEMPAFKVPEYNDSLTWSIFEGRI